MNILKFLIQRLEKTVRLQVDGNWHKVVKYFAAGVGGAITGRGADLLIIDDPHSEQDAMSATALTMRMNGTHLVLVKASTRWSDSFSYD